MIIVRIDYINLMYAKLLSHTIFCNMYPSVLLLSDMSHGHCVLFHFIFWHLGIKMSTNFIVLMSPNWGNYLEQQNSSVNAWLIKSLKIWLFYVLLDINEAAKCGFIGPILDDRFKEKLLKPWKGAHSSHFRVCLSVCLCLCLYASYWSQF